MRRPNAANYRALADAYLANEQFQKASEAFSKASALYAKLGDPNAAKVLSDSSKRYGTVIKLFVERPASTLANGPSARAKFEPISGCYVGVNIEREDATRDPQEFNNLIGKHHALFFTYRAYGMPFPKEYARNLRRGRSALQLAFEPKSLDQVEDDEYLRQFASDARDSGIPIFMRFASEMNGSWTRGTYGGDPELYKQKFQLVARVVRSIAPNVAMVWCPNEMPEAPIPQYYPGPEAVDWVGVNFYSVIYNDADRARGAEWRVPTDALDFVYRTYSKRHPIMVGEWAATHHSVLDRNPRPDFAVNKIAQLYTALPLLYPRVKAVNWLSMNTMQYAAPGRQLNNYSLLDEPSVGERYTQAISNPYFLDYVSDEPQTVPTWQPLSPGTRIAVGSAVAAYVRSYEGSPEVSLKVNGQLVKRHLGAGALSAQLPSNASGPTKLEVLVRDSKGRRAAERTIPVSVTAE